MVLLFNFQGQLTDYSNYIKIIPLKLYKTIAISH